MISYEIKINNVLIKRVDVTRLHPRSDELEEAGYEYRYKVYDFEDGGYDRGSIIHHYRNGFGELFAIICRDSKLLKNLE